MVAMTAPGHKADFTKILTALQSLKVHTKQKRAVLAQHSQAIKLVSYLQSKQKAKYKSKCWGTLTSNHCRHAPMASPGGRPQTVCKNIGITMNKSYF